MKSSRLEADEGQLESLLPFWEVAWWVRGLWGWGSPACPIHFSHVISDPRSISWGLTLLFCHLSGPWHGTFPDLSASEPSTVRSRWQFSHYSECSITQENVEAILIILFNSGGKIWRSINISCSPTLMVLYERHYTSQHPEVSTDGKTQSNQ